MDFIMECCLEALDFDMPEEYLSIECNTLMTIFYLFGEFCSSVDAPDSQNLKQKVEIAGERAANKALTKQLGEEKVAHACNVAENEKLVKQNAVLHETNAAQVKEMKVKDRQIKAADSAYEALGKAIKPSH